MLNRLNRLNRRDGKNRKTGYIVMGILLIIFGLLYSDGAFAYSNNENILYVSVLMFISVFCDLATAVLIFVGISLKSSK